MQTRDSWQELLAEAVAERIYAKLTAQEIRYIVETESYQLLKTIRDILNHPSFSDEERYERINELVRLFTENGLSIEGCDDFKKRTWNFQVLLV